MVPWYVFALLSAAFIVVRDLASKKALFREHSLEMLVARALFLVPMLLILGFFIPLGLPRGALPFLYIVSVLFTAGLLLRTCGLRHLEMGVSAPLQNVSPLFLLFIAAATLGEVPDALQITGIVLIVVGAYFIEGTKEYSGPFGPLRHLWRDKYAWLPIVAGLVLSASQAMDKYLIGGGIAPLTYLFWVWLFINVNLLLLHLVRFRWRGLSQDLVQDWRWAGISAAGLFFQLLTYYFALRQGDVTLVVAITQMSALGLVLLGGQVYHEQSVARRFGAAAIMVVGACLILL